MKKASEFLKVWISGPCQRGISVDDLTHEAWGDSRTPNKGQLHLKYEREGLFVGLEHTEIHIFSNDRLNIDEKFMVEGDVTVRIVRNGFNTVMSSDHPLELAHTIASIIEMDVDRETFYTYKDELPF